MLKFLRLTICYIWLLPSSIAGLFLCLLRPFHPDNTRLASYFLGFFFHRVLGLTVTWKNKDGLEDGRPHLVVSNHQDNLDVLILTSCLPTNTVSIGKKSLSYIPIFGWLYVLAGNILIDRKNKKKALESLNKAKEKITKNSMNVWIMPEGTRSRGRGLLPFKKGPFHLAMHTKVPLIPVVFSEYHRTVDLNRWNSGRVIIKVLDPIDTSGITKENMSEFMDNLYNLMKSEIDIATNEANEANEAIVK